MIIQNNLSWDKAIRENSTSENNSANGIIYNEASGDMYWDMQSIDKSLFAGINNLEVGEYSIPQYYEDRKGYVGYRIFKLVDRT